MLFVKVCKKNKNFFKKYNVKKFFHLLHFAQTKVINSFVLRKPISLKIVLQRIMITLPSGVKVAFCYPLQRIRVYALKET